MSTTTEAVTSSTRAAIAAYDALAETYLTTLAATLRAQTRGFEVTRQALEATLSIQEDGQSVAEQLAGSSRKIQDAWLETAQNNWRVAWASWLGEPRRN